MILVGIWLNIFISYFVLDCLSSFFLAFCYCNLLLFFFLILKVNGVFDGILKLSKSQKA